MTRAKEFIVAQRLDASRKQPSRTCNRPACAAFSYCADYHCSHLATARADIWPDDVRLPIWKAAMSAVTGTPISGRIFCADFYSPGVCAHTPLIDLLAR
jgi:hypothetical protein